MADPLILIQLLHLRVHPRLFSQKDGGQSLPVFFSHSFHQLPPPGLAKLEESLHKPVRFSSCRLDVCGPHTAIDPPPAVVDPLVKTARIAGGPLGKCLSLHHKPAADGKVFLLFIINHDSGYLERLFLRLYRIFF